MSAEQSSDQDKLRLTTQQKIGILCSFAKDKVVEQIQCVWFIILYLVVFQLLVLGLPIVYSLMIAVGIGIVIIGLAFFMEGLRLGLMPLGETLGSTLPRKKIFGIPCLPASLAFGFVLGAFATFAEPAIGVLRAAGSGVDPTLAPLLWTILNTGAANLVNSVGAGVGIAVLLGVLRFYKGWSLKPFIYVGVIVLSTFTLYFQFSDARLQHVLGLAWDCGAVTTGPVTVPLVLALGIGVCRIVSTGGSSNTGFGVVTLASLFPILAVLCYATFLFNGDNYYYATESKADWHKNAGQYGTNYDPDLQRFGDIVAKRRIASAGGASESDMASSLSKEDLAVMHGHQPGSSIIGVLALFFKRSKIPFVYTVHNSFTNFPFFKRIILFLCFFRVDVITFVSQSAYDSFKIHLSQKLLNKSIVIQNGVDMDRVDTALSHIDSQDIKKNSSFRIVCIGRLASQKNLYFLINVMVKLNNNICLDIYGEGLLRDDLQRMINENNLRDRVTLHGNIPRDDLFKYLKKSDLYVSVANYEGLPMAAMEALAVGKYCLLSDIDSHFEIQRLVPSLNIVARDVSKWILEIESIVNMTDEEREKIGKQNREYVKESLTMNKMQEKYTNIYKKINKNRG